MDTRSKRVKKPSSGRARARSGGVKQARGRSKAKAKAKAKATTAARATGSRGPSVPLKSPGSGEIVSLGDLLLSVSSVLRRGSKRERDQLADLVDAMAPDLVVASPSAPDPGPGIVAPQVTHDSGGGDSGDAGDIEGGGEVAREDEGDSDDDDDGEVAREDEGDSDDDDDGEVAREDEGDSDDDDDGEVAREDEGDSDVDDDDDDDDDDGGPGD